MAKHRMDVASFVGKLLEQEDVDALQEGVKVLAQALMEAEVSGQIGADLYERSSERVAYRNGYRTRTWDTRLGTIELKIPKITKGSYFPSLLEPRRRIEKALFAVVTEAYVKGISTRKVDDLVKALGIDGISKSEVSRICRALDKDVHAFRNRPIEVATPYVWLDATYHKVRENVGGDNERVISVATVVAIGVTATGERTVVGVDCGPSEDHVFWMHFLRALVKRGLNGVQLVVSDAHEGLRAAVAKVLAEASWQRCRVHFMRNLLSLIPRDAHGPVATLVRMIFAEPDHASAMAKLREVVRALQTRFPQAAELLDDAAEDLLSHLHFPPEHRRRLHSTNPLERLHKEIKRRTQVVGIFPNRAALLRLVGTLLAEQDDEWQVADRRYFSVGSMQRIGELEGGEIQKELLSAIA
jgi:putative transposase